MIPRLAFSRASKFFIPAAATAFAVGSAFHFSGPTILNEPGKTFTGGPDFFDLKLKKSEQITHDTHRYFFDLNSPDDVSGLVIASCVLTKFIDKDGKAVVRPYTPISDVNEKGVIEFVIKTYPEGKFGNHIASLKEGDTVAFKGPILKWEWKPNSFKEIALIGGGSGITPLYQLVHAIASNPEDKTKVKLLYGNKTADDILIKSELDALQKKYPDQLDITYFLDKAPAGWDGKTGFITKDFLKDKLAPPSGDIKIFVCGPPPLYEAISGKKVGPQDQGELSGALADLGYTKDQVFKF